MERHYAPSDLSPAKTKSLQEKLSKPSEIVVFELTSNDCRCTECDAEIAKGNLFVLEKKQPVCLDCADLGHLEFLPSGDATLTRRARKFSPLAAVVVRFSRRRERYERQGILVTREAIDEAEKSCAGDDQRRAALRELAEARRRNEDKNLVAEMAELIRKRYPGCPESEARQIAAHTAQRGSGRIGRSDAGRNLNPAAIDLAVTAWIRHQHTNYDELLMAGHERSEARDMIRDAVAKWVFAWRETR